MSAGKILKVGGYTIETSNLDKILFPESKITKGEVIEYYENISDYALPYLKDHPLTMLRCPDGINGQQFIQKKVSPYFPQWIDRCEVSSKEGTLQQVIINKKATLVYLANQACITYHLYLSKIDKMQYPSYVIFDIDPSTDDLLALKKVVWHVKKLLDLLELECFLQTSGSKGFHIYVPLKRIFTFQQTHDFAKDAANYLAKEYPNEITVKQSKKDRGNRALIDYARNGYGLSTVAPYSLRAIETAPIATPIHWDELDEKNIGPRTYNIKNIFNRLNQIQDPWADLLNHKLSIDSAIKKLTELM